MDTSSMGKASESKKQVHDNAGKTNENKVSHFNYSIKNS